MCVFFKQYLHQHREVFLYVCVYQCSGVSRFLCRIDSRDRTVTLSHVLLSITRVEQCRLNHSSHTDFIFRSRLWVWAVSLLLGFQRHALQILLFASFFWSSSGWRHPPILTDILSLGALLDDQAQVCDDRLEEVEQRAYAEEDEGIREGFSIPCTVNVM